MARNEIIRYPLWHYIDLFDHISNAASRQQLVRALTDCYMHGGNRSNHNYVETKISIKK